MTEEEDETRRKTFVETGSDAFWSGEEVTMEGFLSMKLGGWRKRWCVIKEETFMFFHGKQEALKQGWLSKKGAGTGTLSRCVLQGLPLHHNIACRDVCGGMALVSSSAPALPCVCVCACRRNWKQRFFVLYPNKRLCYFDKDTVDESSKPAGVIEMANVT